MLSLCSDEWDIKYEELSDLQFLACGAQGTVFLGKCRGAMVAVKKVRDVKEINIRHLRKLSHPNIVEFKYVDIVVIPLTCSHTCLILACLELYSRM